MPIKVRSYADNRENTIKLFKSVFPNEEVFSPVFSEWLLDKYSTLLEKYELSLQFNDGGK